MIQKNITAPFILSLLVWNSAGAGPALSVGESSTQSRYDLTGYQSSMDADEYRNTYQENRHRLQKYITHQSEDSLVSLGLSRNNVHMLGAIAGAAATQNARVYINDSRSLAIDVKDAAAEDRAVFLGVKIDW